MTAVVVLAFIAKVTRPSWHEQSPAAGLSPGTAVLRAYAHSRVVLLFCIVVMRSFVDLCLFHVAV